MKFKKTLSAILCMCVMAMAPMTTQALTIGTAESLAPITVNSISTNDTHTSLSIQSGTAYVTALVNGYQNNATKVVVYAHLQRYENGSWSNVANWSQTFNSYSGVISESCSVARGYTYRVSAAYYVFSGSSSEMLLQFSGTVAY